MLSATGQILFGTSDLKELYSELPAYIKKEITRAVPGKQTERIELHQNLDDKKLIVSFENGVIVNLGIGLTGFNLTNKYDSVVKEFIQRIMLKLSFDKCVPDMVKTLETMQAGLFYQDNNILFSPLRNFDDLLVKINRSARFTITKNNYLFKLQWLADNDKITFTFPNSYQLIAGKNKKELDEIVLRKLQQLSQRTSTINNTRKYETSSDTFPVSVVIGQKYLNILSSDTYYKITGTDSILIFEKNLPTYSVLNLFLKKELSGNHHLLLNDNIYGAKAVTLKISLYEFLNFLGEDFRVLSDWKRTGKIW